MNYFINLSMDEIKTAGYEPIGFPGIINCGFSTIATGFHETKENFAKEVINANHKKEFEYDAFAAYSFEDKEANQHRKTITGTIIDKNNETKGLHLLIIQPLKKIF